MFWNRLGGFDKWLIGVALFTLVISSFFITQDRWLFRWRASDTESLERIGRAKTALNDVRSRHKTAFSWAPLEENGEVFQGDSIFTGEKSEALITTDRGEQISISPNSLVVINAKSDTIRLDINYGSVLGQVGKDKKLQVASGGEVTEFRGDDALVKVDVGEGKNLVVNVVQGQVEVTSDKGKKSIGPNQQAQIGEAGAVIDPSDVRIDLITPVPDRVLKPDEGRDLVLTWKSTHPFAEYNVEIAKDPDFKDLILKEKSTRPLFKPPQMPANKRIYWRILATLKPGTPPAASPMGAFIVSDDTPPRLVFPQDETNLTFEEQPVEEGDALVVVLRWQKISASEKWEVQYSKSPDFTTGLRSTITPDSFWATGPLREGRYFYRVRARDWPDAMWSDSASFSITRKSPASLKAPSVVTHSDQFLLVTKASGLTQDQLSLVSTLDTAKYVEAVPELEWNTIVGASAYEIQISSRRDFESLLIREDVPSTHFAWQSVRVGKFYWRIRSINSSSKRGPFTEPQALSVLLAPPGNLTDEKTVEEVSDLTVMETAPPPFVLRWSPTLFTKSYEVQFDATTDFRKPLRVLTSNSFKKVQAGFAGVYYWRVRSLGPTNAAVTEFSPPYKYEYVRTYLSPETTKELRALFPNDETLMMIGQGELKINFKWASPVKDTKYRFQLAREPEFTKPSRDEMVERESLLSRQKMEDGWWYWRVRVESPSFTSPWTAAYRFQIKHEDSSFNFERSERTQEEDRRKYDEDRKRRMVEEAKALASEMAARKGEEDLNLPLLDPPSDAQGPDPFVVETQPTSVADLTNFEKLSLSEMYHRVKEPPLLEWRAVADATEYKVEISPHRDFKGKVQTAMVNRPAYRWLTVHPGRFYWRVQAMAKGHRASAFTDPVSLSVSLARPSLSTPTAMLLPSSESEVILKWSPIVFARSYEVQWSQSPTFTQSNRASSPDHQFKLKVGTEGTYYWRVRALDQDVLAITDFTEPRPLNLKFSPRQPASASALSLQFPPANYVIKTWGGEAPRLGLYWQSSAKSGQYLVEISKDKDFHEVVYTSSTTKQSIVIESPVADGILYWRVTQLQQGQVVKKTDPIGFVIEHSQSNRVPGQTEGE